MSEIVLGTNRFMDCETPFTLGGRPLLRVGLNPLRLSLFTPSDDPRVNHVEIENNETKTQGQVQVERTDSSVWVLYRDQLVASALQVGEDKVMVTLDLRPLKLNVHTEASALFVGSTRFQKSSFLGGAGINLG